jgi:hypothetical protein
MVLMITGMALYGVLTASIACYFVGQDERDQEHRIEERMQEILAVRTAWKPGSMRPSIRPRRLRVSPAGRQMPPIAPMASLAAPRSPRVMIR